MTATVSRAEFEALQGKVDKLENVLCDLATPDVSEHSITPVDIKKALQDAGILGKDSDKP